MQKWIEIASTKLTSAVFEHDLSLTLPVDVNLLPADRSPHLLLHTVPVLPDRGSSLYQCLLSDLSTRLWTYIWPVMWQNVDDDCIECSSIRLNKSGELVLPLSQIHVLFRNNIFPWFSTGLTDGIIRTYDLFTAYNPGYFQLEILACDFAGHSTTTNVNIYILRDDQRVKIVFNEIPDLVRENQEDFVNLLSNITGAIVNLDDIQVRPFLW